MYMEVELANIMMKVTPKIYRMYVIFSIKWEPILYVQIKKSLYGPIRSAKLFYRELVNYIESYGLHINPYDPCLAKKMMNYKQMMVLWHVDGLKESHVNRF